MLSAKQVLFHTPRLVFVIKCLARNISFRQNPASVGFIRLSDLLPNSDV